MQFFLPIFLLFFLLSGCDADTPNATTGSGDSKTQTAALPKNTAGMGLTLRWPQPDFKTQKIPETAKTVQIEITETGTFNNLYRTTIDRLEVSGEQVTRQIRIDMQGKSEREVLLLVTAKNERSNVVAKGQKTFKLQAGVRNAVELIVSEVGGTVIIGGGGGGGGGGGSNPTPTPGPTSTPIPTPIPTLAPTTYTLTPLSSTISLNVGETIDIPIKIWNGNPIYTFSLNAKLPEGIDLFNGLDQKIPESPEGTIPSGSLSQSSDTIYLRGTVLSDASNLSLNLAAVIDGGLQSTSKNYQILIRKPQIIPNQVSTPRSGEAFTQSFKVINSVGAYTWSHTGSLPPGLSFSFNNTDTVTLSGTPNNTINAQTYRFTLQVTDGKGRIQSQTYVLGCGDGAIVQYRAAQPVVNTVSPVAGTNTSSQTITLTGERFISGSTVLLDQAVLNTTFVNSTTLQAVVPAGVKPGEYDVIVVNPDTSVGRIEGGLALAYKVNDGGGFVTAQPNIGGIYVRNTPVTPEVTNEELESQLLTVGETTVGTIDRDDPNNAFMTMLVVGSNFTPETRVFVSSYALPSVYVNPAQILVIVPISQLYYDLQSPHNRLVLVNPNLEKSSVTQGVFSLATNQATLEGPGAAYLAYVYPQKGPADRDVVVNVRGCGFERPHAFRISTIENNLERSVETSISAKVVLPAYYLFPSTRAFDISVFGVNAGERFLSNTATQVYTPISKDLSVSSCEPNTVGTGITKGVNVFGSGFIPGMQVSFLLQNSDAIGNEFPALATTTAQTNAIIPLVSAGMPAGEYKVKVIAPDSDVYPGGRTIITSGTCLTLQNYEPSNPVINNISPTTVSNNEETPFDLTINGSDFFPGAEISIGAKTVTEGTGNGYGQIIISSNNFKNMKPGVYPLYVQNVDGRTALLENAITVTDAGIEISNGPQITNVVPQYDNGQYFYSLVLGLEQGKVSFNVGNIAPGALAQLVEDPNDPVRPDEAYLSRLVISGNAVSAFVPNLPGGTVGQPKNYYVRMVNPDGQFATSTTPIQVVNAMAPEIETDPTALLDVAYNGCQKSMCPSRGPQNQPVSVRINGVNLNSRTPNLNFGKHPANSSVNLVPVGGGPGIPLETVRTYGDVVYGTIPDALVPGNYRVQVVNPDGQTNDVTNSGAKLVTYEVYASTSKWDKSGRMNKEIISGIHGRSGASVTLDPDTQKMYFFGGNDARTCYNLPTRRLLSYSATSGWEDLGDDRNTTNTSEDYIPQSMLRRSQSTIAFKNDAVSSANDKIFMFGGLNYSAAATSGTCPYGPTLTNTQVLNDLWMYNVATKNWEELSLDTTQVGNPLPGMLEAGIHWSQSDNSLYIYGGILSTGFANNTLYKVVVNETTKKFTWNAITPVNTRPSANLPSEVYARYKIISDPARNRFFMLGGLKYTWTDTNTNGLYDSGETVTGAVLNDDIFMYDVAKNKWVKLAQSGAGYASRYDFSVSINPTGQRLYVYGGRGANCTNNFKNPDSCSRKDLLQIGQFTNFTGDADSPPSLSWTTESTLPVEQRSSHVLQWADNGLYLFGGIKEDGEVALFMNGTPAYPGTVTNPDPYHDPGTDFWQYIP